jgi:hypothetical protein
MNDRVGANEFVDRQGALVGVQGAARPGPRVGGDLLGVSVEPVGSAASTAGWVTDPGLHRTPARR